MYAIATETHGSLKSTSCRNVEICTLIVHQTTKIGTDIIVSVIDSPCHRSYHRPHTVRPHTVIYFQSLVQSLFLSLFVCVFVCVSHQRRFETPVERQSFVTTCTSERSSLGPRAPSAALGLAYILQ